MQQQTLSLFEQPENQWRASLAEKLRALAEQQLWLGSSSWKYEGWLGSIYTRERYAVKGRFSAKCFERECLREYAEVFPIVSGDFAFYQFPSAGFWLGLFEQVEDTRLQFAFKAPEDITTARFPDHPRYGTRAGRVNGSFLSAELFETEFLRLLRPYAERVSLLMFEFPAGTVKAFSSAAGFGEALKRFFEALPKIFRYAVEIRSAGMLDNAYFAALRGCGVAHIFNSWTDMPAITEQMKLADAFTADFTVVRALMQPGRLYQESVDRFAPFSELKEPNAEVREAVRELLVRARTRKEPVFAFFNNRLEGFTPGTIEAIAAGL